MGEGSQLQPAGETRPPPLESLHPYFLTSLLLSPTNSTTLSSAQNRSAPCHREINPQCPPRSGVTNCTRAFFSTSVLRNASYGTNGSSFAVIASSNSRTVRIAPNPFREYRSGKSSAFR